MAKEEFETITLGHVAIGDRYARLVVQSVLKRTGTYRYYAACLCDCGNEKIVRVDSLRNGNIKSCGCFHKEVITKHKLSTHPLSNRWRKMIDRCTNNKCAAYKNYGARGIKVCERWLDIANFIEDVGPSYIDGLQLDRINNNGDYEPSNVRWTTASENCDNRRTGRKIEFNGKTQSMTRWAKEIGISVGTLWERLEVWKWGVEKALTTKPLDSHERMAKARSALWTNRKLSLLP